MKVYAALYNPMIHESAEATLSLHLSLENAEKATKEHKEEKLREYEEMNKGNDWFKKSCPFGQLEWWGTAEIEVLP